MKYLPLIALLAIGSASAAEKPAASQTTAPATQAPSSKAETVLTLGLPVNTSGISIAGRPNIINFVGVKSDNTVDVDWSNVCKVVKAQPFTIKTLSTMSGQVEEYILPYALYSANPTKCN